MEQLRGDLEKKSEEQEDSVMEVKRRHEREKAMLLDENKKLLSDVERVSCLCGDSGSRFVLKLW